MKYTYLKVMDNTYRVLRLGNKTEIFFGRTRDLINGAIQDNTFMKKLDPSQIREIVACMSPLDINAGNMIIQEGSEGSLVYAIEGLYTTIPLTLLSLCLVDWLPLHL